MSIKFIDIDKWEEIFKSLRKNRFRTVMTAFGVSWGVFMLIILVGTGNGLQSGVSKGFANFATNSMFLWTQTTSKAYNGFQPGRYINLTNEDIIALKNNISEIGVIAPRNELGSWHRSGDNYSISIVRGIKKASFSIRGDYPEFSKIEKVNVTKGRYLNQYDIEDKRKIAIIGKRVYEVLFNKGEEPIGKYISINGIYFTVVGIFESDNAGHRMNSDETIFIPFTVFQNAFNYGNRIDMVALSSKKDIPVSLLETKVKTLLAKRHNVHPDDKQAINSFNLEEQFNMVSGLFMGISFLIWLVGTGTLLAGVIGVSNIMLIVVKERTKEIGIRRALGASPYKIVNQIMLESITLTIIAGSIGLSLGVGLIETVNNLLKLNSSETSGESMFGSMSVNLNVALLAIIILIVSGALAGLIPARRAIKIKTVEALKDE
ncbi:MAG: hypothetical protein A2X12_07255 [Bacteroidetes bacterium GWE2_29_8]|nr:MAG: hypothetical protein A2X12_07255 [Bacteroidetes bacterium GWE2_29_8]OFY17163.1 MAG: hypothetical protein A2X02_03455 [Bacteroidetes bacterium GWF2_29_10]